MHQRQQQLLEMMRHGMVEIKRAAVSLGVAEMTIRRDLQALAEQRLVMLVKGGAVVHPSRYEPEHSERNLTAAKYALAEALYQRIMPIDSLYLSTGFTVLAFANVLARRCLRPLTVITNSLSAAAALFRTPCKVMLLGGELRANSLDLVGPMAEKDIDLFHVDMVVSGCDGACGQRGFYSSDLNLSRLERKTMAIADNVAIITESTKFGKKKLANFALPHEVDLLVTDDALPAEERDVLAQVGVEVMVVRR
jgi:DeoR/GlpR family transcriptional regulator of sugar metabolism